MPSNFQLSFHRELEAGLRRLEAQSGRRSLAEIRGVNFCSNDYLGLAENAALKEAIAEAARGATRTGGTGSRLLSGHAAVWAEVEEEFARFPGPEAALYFGSGYVANLGLLASLLKKEDLVFSDSLIHPPPINALRPSASAKLLCPHPH